MFGGDKGFKMRTLCCCHLSAYALLISHDRRKHLSAYFTPPALAPKILIMDKRTSTPA